MSLWLDFQLVILAPMQSIGPKLSYRCGFWFVGQTNKAINYWIVESWKVSNSVKIIL